jgi:hypothetical protein
MCADIQPFSQDPRRRSASARRDRNLDGVFAFVQRWAARSRIDDKLTRLESLSPESFRGVASRIETIVDEALAAVPPPARHSGGRAKSVIRLTWVVVALAITIGLIVFGQQLAETFRSR